MKIAFLGRFTASMVVALVFSQVSQARVFDLIRTVRVRPFEQYVLKVVPQQGNAYLGFADFSFTEGRGKTHLTYDIYVELHVPPMNEEEFREFSRQQYEQGLSQVNRNNQKLKALVESHGR